MKEIVNYLQELKKKWRIIAIVTLIFVLVALVFTKFFIKDQYEATTKIFLGKQNFQNTSEEYNNEEVQLYQRLVTTYSEIIKTRRLISSSINESKVNKGKLEDLTTFKTAVDNLTVTPITDTQLIELKYKGYNGQESYDLLYSITEKIIAYSKELYPTVNIKVLEQVDVVKSNLVIKKITIILLSFIFGLGGSCAVVILLSFNGTYKNKEQLERELEINVFGVIPNIEG